MPTLVVLSHPIRSYFKPNLTCKNRMICEHQPNEGMASSLDVGSATSQAAGNSSSRHQSWPLLPGYHLRTVYKIILQPWFFYAFEIWFPQYGRSPCPLSPLSRPLHLTCPSSPFPLYIHIHSPISSHLFPYPSPHTKPHPSYLFSLIAIFASTTFTFVPIPLTNSLTIPISCPCISPYSFLTHLHYPFH